VNLKEGARTLIPLPWLWWIMGVCLYCQAPLEEGAVFCPHCCRTQFTFGSAQGGAPRPWNALPTVNRGAPVPPPASGAALSRGTPQILQPLPAVPGAVLGPWAPPAGAPSTTAPLPVGSRQCPTCNAVISIRAVVCPVCATPILPEPGRAGEAGEGSGRP